MSILIPSILNVEGLSKSYDLTQVLSCLNFRVKVGECLCIVGRSGVGKSVLTRLLTGLEASDTGRIEYYGQNYATASESTWNRLRRKIGLVFQQSALLDSLTIEENLLLNLRDSPLMHSVRCEEVLAEVGLDSSVLPLFPAELSGGMRKRIGIARAIIHKPDILFYDEPTAGLDPVNAHRIDRLMKKLNRTGRTSIIVTHDMDTVRALASHILWLQGNSQYQFMPAEAFFHSGSELLVRSLLNGHAVPESGK